MLPLKFEWKYIAGVQAPRGTVKKYRDELLGVIKEEILRPGENVPDLLYYIPGDHFTYTTEEHLVKRIDNLLREEGFERSNELYKPNHLTFSFMDAKPVLMRVYSEELIPKHLENGRLLRKK